MVDLMKFFRGKTIDSSVKLGESSEHTTPIAQTYQPTETAPKKYHKKYGKVETLGGLSDEEERSLGVESYSERPAY